MMLSTLLYKRMMMATLLTLWVIVMALVALKVMAMSLLALQILMAYLLDQDPSKQFLALLSLQDIRETDLAVALLVQMAALQALEVMKVSLMAL